VDPTFLSLAEVLEIHKDQVARYGGAPGIRDIESLKSALGMPAATYDGQFLHTEPARILLKPAYDRSRKSLAFCFLG
jgi:death-on-curing protein